MKITYLGLQPESAKGRTTIFNGMRGENPVACFTSKRDVENEEHHHRIKMDSVAYSGTIFPDGRAYNLFLTMLVAANK